MNVRVQRLCRTYGPQKTLPILCKRSIATEDVGAKSQIAPVRLDPETTALQKKKASHVHPALAQGHEIGGHLKPGFEPLKKHDMKRTWGEWGIPVKLLAWNGAHVFTM